MGSTFAWVFFFSFFFQVPWFCGADSRYSLSIYSLMKGLTVPAAAMHDHSFFVFFQALQND